MEGNSPSVAVQNATSNFSYSATVTTANWGFLAIFMTFIFVVVIILNSLVLFFFIKDPRLKTSFSTYLICLLSLNILYAVIQNPLDIINDLYSYWLAGFRLCSLYIYALYFLQAASMHIHLLITCNRAWAVTFPLSHRRVHSHKWGAIILCICAWLYVHLLLLPGYTEDALWYRPLLKTNQCFLNADAQQSWSLSVQFIVYVMPEVLILAVYPYIWYKQRSRKKMRTNKVGPKSFKNLFIAHTAATAVTNSIDIPLAHNVVPQNHSLPKNESLPKKTSSNAFAVLTLLTCSIFVTWTPQTIYVTVLSFIPIDYPTLFEVTNVFYAVQPILDPILFTAALKDLRTSIRETFRQIPR